MARPPSIFLSYCRANRKLALNLETALANRGLGVWRDERSISGGEEFSVAIEKGIRESRGLLVLVTTESTRSDWVTYEYAFATGAGVPVVAVGVKGTKLPSPIRRFQVVRYSNAKGAAAEVDRGLRKQARAAGQARAASPKLVAKFQEMNGAVLRASGGRTPSLCMELWVEHAPRTTKSVTFEIPDEGVEDNKWTVKRSGRDWNSYREFLTDEELNLWGDVEMWAYGSLPGRQSWSANSTLYEALQRYYRNRATTPEIRRALVQIRKN